MKKILAGLLLFALMLSSAGLMGCNNNSAKDGENDAKEIIIGTGNAFNPYCYLDEKNNLTGFEIELLEKIDELLPQYTFKFKAYDFANILLSLESGAIDLAAHQFEYNIERVEKYLYGSEGYTTYKLHLVVRDDRNDITKFEDMEGKILGLANTTNNAYYTANKWNVEHGNPFKIEFAESLPLIFEGLANGTFDAFIQNPRNVENYKKEYNAAIKISGEPVCNSNTFYLYNKQSGQELKEAVDGALKTLKENGTVLELALKWIGEDCVAID